MLFNSLEFLLFFPAVAVAYFAIPRRYRAVFLLAASYYFYASWKPVYLLLIVASTVVDYVAALQMSRHDSKRARRKYLLLSLFVNLGLLLFFKYFNFFSDSLEQGLRHSGLLLDLPNLDILLPVGISFYTFQTLSYSIDVYRGSLKAETSFVHFALYVSFFPQLVAGPIERPGRLLPQLRDLSSRWDGQRVHQGFQQILRGLLLKTCIADRIAPFVLQIFDQPETYSNGWLLVGGYLFAFQIYCDFSGYSDIAIGSARILGINLMENFRRPYFSESLTEFWQRWHISLSTWFRDYVYIPLGSHRGTKFRVFITLMITFTVSGLWHGANWTFVVWGAFHGVLIAASSLKTNRPRRRSNGLAVLVLRLFRMVYVFHLVVIGLIFFRASNIESALYFFERFLGLVPEPAEITNRFLFGGIWPHFNADTLRFDLGVIAASVLLFMTYECVKEWRPRWIRVSSVYSRWFLYGLAVAALLFVGKWGTNDFIYFQF